MEPQAVQARGTVDDGVVRLEIVGQSLIAGVGGELGPRSQHLFALILMLAAQAGSGLQRDHLAALLFAGPVDAKSRLHNLRQLLYRARGLGYPIEEGRHGILLPAPRVWSAVDATITERDFVRGGGARALVVLPDYAPRLTDAYTEWVDAFRDAQHAKLRAALVRAVDDLRHRGDWELVRETAAALLVLDPANETATLAVAESHALSGSKQRALSTLTRYEEDFARLDRDAVIPAMALRRRVYSQVRDAYGIDDVPLLGREEILASLSREWQRARGGVSTITVLRGATGIGKSRVCEGLRVKIALEGSGSVIMHSRTSRESFRPYALFAELLQVLQACPGALGMAPEHRPYIGLLLNTPGVQVPGEVGTPEDVAMRTSAITRAVADLFDAVCHERPVLLILDDSRGIDDASLTVLQYIVDSAPKLPLHVVIAAEYAEARPAIRQVRGGEHTLAPLADGPALKLARLHLGAQVAAQARAEWCVAMSGGSPAVLGLLAHEIVLNPGVADAPNDLVVLVDRALGRLDRLSMRLLSACCVIGEQCTPDLLTKVCGLPTSEMLDAIEALTASALVKQAGEFLVPSSAVIRERALRRTPETMLVTMHTLCAQVLEGEDGTAKGVAATSSAYHWFRAGHIGHATDLLIRRWHDAMSMGELTECDAQIEHLLGEPLNTASRAAVLDAAIDVSRAAGHRARVTKHIDARLNLQHPLTDIKRSALLYDDLDAKIALGVTRADHLATLKRFAVDANLDRRRHYAAVCSVLAIADTIFDCQLAKELYIREGNIDADLGSLTPETLNIEIIFHASFGDRSRAENAALEVLRRWEAPARPEGLSRVVLNAAFCLHIVTSGRKGRQTMIDLYNHSLSEHNFTMACKSAAAIADQDLDFGERSTARLWLKKALHLVADDPHDEYSLPLIAACFHDALLHNREETAANSIGMMEGLMTESASRRFQMHTLSLRSRYESSHARPLARDAYEELREWHELTRDFGRQDDELAAIVCQMVYRGDRASAQTYLNRYVHEHRREARPIGYMAARDICGCGLRLPSLALRDKSH